MSSIVNQSPYLRTSRSFPEEEAQKLAVEVNRSYIDIAEKMNKRTISLHPTTRPAINGESWFLSQNKQQQGLRQVYIVPSGTVNGSTIDLGFKISSISQFSPKCYGSFTDNTNWYGIIFASNVAIAGQLSFFIELNGANTKSDRITFRKGAGAPTVQSGLIVIEWLSEV